ncbi:MAG: SDR family NAD(P)-dependent oxidoreductase [Fibrobacterota bacterium]
MKRKAILITGALRRLGRELALESARMGFDVVAHYRTSGQEAAVLERDIRALGGTAYFVRHDLARNAEGLLAKCRCLPVTLVGLVNSASVFEKGNFRDLSPAQIQRVFALNVFAPLALTAGFAAEARTGMVINLLDANIDRFSANFQAYRASKRLLRDMTRECALLFAPRVRVNAIAPGALLPSRRGRRQFDAVRKRTPLGTGGSLADFRAAFRYLLGQDSVTGQVLQVDGGLHLQ